MWSQKHHAEITNFATDNRTSFRDGWRSGWPHSVRGEDSEHAEDGCGEPPSTHWARFNVRTAAEAGNDASGRTKAEDGLVSLSRHIDDWLIARRIPCSSINRRVDDQSV